MTPRTLPATATLLFAICLSRSTQAQVYTTVDTYAGNGVPALVDGPLLTASFNAPYSVCYDLLSSTMYVADALNSAIRKIQNGVVTTVAGNGTIGDVDGNGASARFYTPTGIDYHDGYIYVCDNGNHKIKRIDSAGNVTTFAGTGASGSSDGLALSANFYNPTEVRVNSSGVVYVSDYGNHTIRKIQAGYVSTVAGLAGSSGDAIGSGSAARFNRPTGIAFDEDDNLYIADQVNCKVKVISPIGDVTLLAGSGYEFVQDGQGSAASFMRPTFMGWDPSGALMIGEWLSNRIRRVTVGGTVTTVAGSGIAGYEDGPCNNAQFSSPYGVCVDNLGNGYIGDKLNNRIRRLNKDNAGIGFDDVQESAALVAYPNPVEHTLSIDRSVLKERIKRLVIMDAGGRIHMNVDQVLGSTQDKPLLLPVDELPSGAYVVILNTSERSLSAPFIKL